MKTRALFLATLIAFVQGCSGWWPFGSSGGEGNRVPPGAMDFACADGKRLFVRLLDNGKAAWVILPDREFRLDQSGASERYSNGTSTLSLTGDSASLDIEGSRQFADCKRKSS
mgnify:FL=1